MSAQTAILYNEFENNLFLKLLPHLSGSNELTKVFTFSGMFMVKLQLFSYFGEVVRESSRAVSVSILRWC